MIPLIWGPLNSWIIETESRTAVGRGLGGGGGESLLNGDRVSSFTRWKELWGCWMHIMSAFNTTELYTSRQLRRWFLCYVHLWYVFTYYKCMHIIRFIHDIVSQVDTFGILQRDLACCMRLGIVTMQTTTGSRNCVRSRWLWSEKRTEIRSRGALC